jgi:hypothetical protein
MFIGAPDLLDEDAFIARIMCRRINPRALDMLWYATLALIVGGLLVWTGSLAVYGLDPDWGLPTFLIGLFLKQIHDQQEAERLVQNFVRKLPIPPVVDSRR